MVKKNIGIITQVTGAVVDVSFEKDLPAINKSSFKKGVYY